jgi:uncharacterized phiE125 gp8 family phage protein
MVRKPHWMPWKRQVINLALKLITAPTQDPVTLPELKEYYRGIDGNDFDITITNLIKAAREAARKYQNRAFFTQIWELSFDHFPTMPCKIPLPPLQSIVSVKYYDQNGIETTMNLADFVIDKRSEPGRISFKSGKSWPAVTLQEIDSVVIQFTAGHNDISKVPNTVKLAYMVFITHRLDNPGSEDIPQAFYSLLGSDRLVPV